MEGSEIFSHYTKTTEVVPFKRYIDTNKMHKVDLKPDANLLRHPADGDAWKDFDDKYPDFALDPRNLRLGLATDGFSPFVNMSNSYSMWPVLVIPYNLPPMQCTDQSNCLMALGYVCISSKPNSSRA